MKTIHNPFKEVLHEDKAELDLISQSLQGDLHALESIILRHQSWIYNLAIRMVYDPYAAEDITQEVLIKLITKLGSFDPEKSAFRTWLYRIVVNHVINAKRSKNESIIENALRGEGFEEFVARVPDRRSPSRPGSDMYSDEIKMACVQCILFCLNRRERMIFILGVVFGVTDVIGSEICEVSKVNFRKILSRSRNKVYLFFRDNCSLLNESNPCRCSDYLNPLIKGGLINPKDLLVMRDSHGSIQDAVSSGIRHIEDSYGEFVSLFRSQPFLKPPDMILWLRDLFGRDDIKHLFQIA